MKLLSIILQNSKGDPILLLCSNQFSLTTSINYSYLIYQYMLTSYRNSTKLQRSFAITNDQYCISNFTKDFTLSIIVSKNDLMLGFDGLKKLSEFFNRNIKMENVMKRIVELFGVFEQFLYCRQLPLSENWLPARPDKSSRKRLVDFEILNRFAHIHYQQEKRTVVQIQLRQAKLQQMSNGLRHEVTKNSQNFCIKIFEQQNLIIDSVKETYIVNYKNRLFANGFTRRKPQPLQVSNYEEEPSIVSTLHKRKQSTSLKQSLKDTLKGLTAETLTQKQNSFPLKKINSTDSTQLLIPKPKLESISTKSSKQIVEQSDLFLPQELEQDLIEVLQEASPRKQQNKTDIQSLSTSQATETALIEIPPTPPKLPTLQIPHQISFMDVFHVPCSPRPDLAVSFNNPSAKVRMNQKLQLVLVEQKVKSVNQYGQVAVQVNSLQKLNITLVSSNWLNKKYVITRVTPNSFKVKQHEQHTYQVEADEISKSKGVIDYIISKQTFNYNKIPLMFVSNFETRKNNKQNIIQYTFKYKVNDKWKGTLHDIDIQVVLDPYIIFSDCKTNPLANSLKGKIVNWKAKELTQNAKGKLALALYDCTMDPRDIIKQIKLSMRAEKSLLTELDVEFCSAGGLIKNKAKKNLVIEYKIIPK